MDDACELEPGCPDEAWLENNGVYLTDVPSLRLETLADRRVKGRSKTRDPHEVIIVLLDGDTIRYRRVQYDIEATIKKIYAISDLDNFLGDRLRDGR